MKMLVIILISFFVVYAQDKPIDIFTIVEKAKEKHEVFRKNVNTMELVVEDQYERNRYYYKNDQTRVECQSLNKSGNKFIDINKISCRFEQGCKVFINEWWNLDFKTAKMAMGENVDGKKCYVIIAENPDFNMNINIGNKMFSNNLKSNKLWIHEKTLNILKKEEERIIVLSDQSYKRLKEGNKNNKKIVIEKSTIEKRTTKYFDYRAVVENWEMPYNIEESNPGNFIRKKKVVSVKVNSELSDDLFQQQMNNTGWISNVQFLPAFKKEENAVLDFNVFFSYNVVGLTEIGKNIDENRRVLNVLNINKDVYKGLLAGDCKINKDDFVVSFKEPIYISKISFKARNVKSSVKMDSEASRDCGIQVHYTNEFGENKVLKMFNPIGKSYFDVDIKDYVQNVKVNNANPKDAYPNLFYQMLRDIEKVYIHCVAGKKSVESKVKDGAGSRDSVPGLIEKK